MRLPTGTCDGCWSRRRGAYWAQRCDRNNPDGSDEGLAEYEAGYEELIAKRFPVVTLCQYDVRHFPGVTILNTLRLHRDNFRYPADRFLG